MNKQRIIALSATGVSIAISIIILIQVMPYMNLRNCQVSQEMNLTGVKITVVNNGDQLAKFPTTKFKLYRGSVFIGNGTINEFVIPPHSNITKKVNFDIKVKLTDIPSALTADTTKIDGTVYIKFLWYINLPIKYDVISNQNGSVVHVLGREIVVG